MREGTHPLTLPRSPLVQEKKEKVVKMTQDDMDADLDSYIKGRATGDAAAEAPAAAAAPATE